MKPFVTNLKKKKKMVTIMYVAITNANILEEIFPAILFVSDG